MKLNNFHKALFGFGSQLFALTMISLIVYLQAGLYYKSYFDNFDFLYTILLIILFLVFFALGAWMIYDSAILLKTNESLAVNENTSKRLQNLMDDVYKWSVNTFGEPKNKKIYLLNHLIQEIDEIRLNILGYLYFESEEHKNNVPEESADCFILLVNYSKLVGMNSSDLLNALPNKNQIDEFSNNNGLVETTLEISRKILNLKYRLENSSDPGNKYFMDIYVSFMCLVFSLELYDLSTMDDLILQAEIKMKINKNRKWGKPDKNGIIRHI